MATTPTQNPVPSESPRDLKFNAGKIDEFVTSIALKYIDRFGYEHYTIEGLRQIAQQAIAAFGWITIDSFQDGATLTLPNQVLRWKLPDGDGEYYRWDGEFPKVVPSASTPASTGGIGDGAWVSIGDAALRAMLISSADGMGDSLIAVKQPYVGGFSRTQHDKNSDAVSIKDFGATWNGDIHLLSERYSSLSEAQAVYPFVTSLSQSIDYAALQAALNTGKTVLLPYGTGYVNSTIFFNNSVRLIGEGTSTINRSQSFISVVGNISLFALAQGTASSGKFIQVFIDGLYIFYSTGSTPTNPSGNSGKIAFNFYSVIESTTSLEMAEIKNCTVHGAWRCFSDTTGMYLTKLENVWSRNCHDGFIKATGTTLTLDRCYVIGAISPYQFGAIVSGLMLNCALDQSTISINAGTFGGAGIHITGSTFNIVGFDAEANSISTDGGGTAALIHFENSLGCVSGLVGVGNTMATLSPTTDGNVAFIRASGTSQLEVRNTKDNFSDATGVTYTGSGYPAMLQAEGSAKITVHNSKFRASSGGSPVISTASTGNVSWFDSNISGIISGGYTQKTSAYGLQTPGFFTANGSTAVNAGSPVSLFTLPSTEGVYLISTWGSGSGTNYESSHLASYEGTVLTLTPLKNNTTYTTFSVSGLNVRIQTSGTLTIKWSYTRLS